MRDLMARAFAGLWWCALVAGCGSASVDVSPARFDKPVPVAIREWRVPWAETRPRDPFVDQGHRVWFVGQFGDYVARLDPATGGVRRFALDAGTGPHNVLIDRDGMAWYTGITSAHLGKIDPETGKTTKVPLPDPAATDPHTLVADPRGSLWFTVIRSNFIGRLDLQTGAIVLLSVPTPAALPYGIVLDPQDRPWFAEFGTNKLGMVDPTTMAIREVTLPRPETRCRRLAATSDGHIWYVDYAAGILGRLEPSRSLITEWPTPGGADARPYGMTVDDRDRIWFVETGPQPNRLVGFDPATSGFFNVTEIPSGGGAVRNMVFYPPARELWFGTDTGTIGRAMVP